MFDSAFHDGVKRPGAREMTAMLAGLMALNAFAIDAMVPALPDIGRSLHVAHENDRQLVVIAYFVGFAATQLLWGPLADRFGQQADHGGGRRPLRQSSPCCARSRRRFPVLIAGGVLMGGVGGSDTSARRRDGPRSVRGRGDGAGHEPRLHDLHAGPGAGAQRRPADPAVRALARDLHRSGDSTRRDDHLAVAEAAGDAAPRVSSAASICGRWAARCSTRCASRSRAATRSAMTVSFVGARRLHLLDPADRVRCLPRGTLHRAGVRLHRGTRWPWPPGSTRGSSAGSGCAASATPARSPS